MEYKAICKENQLITGTGTTAIVTGWTPKEAIARHLDSSEYAAIGQLYSPARGISFLIRNLLANPHVDAICLLSATREDQNAKAVQCLYDFFQYGYFEAVDPFDDQTKWKIESDIEGWIDGDIHETSLKRLLDAVAVNWYVDKKKLIKEVKEECLYFGDGDRDPEIYPEPKRENNSILPGVLCGQRVEADTVAEAWVKLLQRIRTNGVIRPTGYDGSWQELIDLVVVVRNEPKDFFIPEYLPCDEESVNDYLSQMCEDKEYEEGVKYTYGQRIFSWFGKDQFQQVRDKLIKEIDSASGVICLWDSGAAGGFALDVDKDYFPYPPNLAIQRFGRNWGDSDHDHGGSPCLNHIWFRVVQGRLIMSALFRSNDMFSAWPNNAFGLRELQCNMLDDLNYCIENKLKLGELITISQSAHIYEDCYSYADSVIANQYHRILKAERKTYSHPPCGNFIVFWEQGRVTVTQTNSKGDFVRIYVGGDAFLLTRKIIDYNPSIMPDHAGYLGHEITKCIMQKGNYIQDRG